MTQAIAPYFSQPCLLCEEILPSNQIREIITKNANLPDVLTSLVLQYIMDVNVVITPCGTSFHLSCHESWILKKTGTITCCNCSQLNIYSLNDIGKYDKRLELNPTFQHASFKIEPTETEITYDQLMSIHPEVINSETVARSHLSYVIHDSTINERTHYSLCKRVAGRCCVIFWNCVLCGSGFCTDSPDSPIASISPTGTVHKLWG